jgi:hypothetical protein
MQATVIPTHAGKPDEFTIRNYGPTQRQPEHRYSYQLRGFGPEYYVEFRWRIGDMSSGNGYLLQFPLTAT